MSLQLSITQGAEDKTNKTVEVFDTTGLYSVSNPTGYGSPNPELADLFPVVALWRNGELISYTTPGFVDSEPALLSIPEDGMYAITYYGLTEPLPANPDTYLPGVALQTTMAYFSSMYAEDKKIELIVKIAGNCCKKDDREKLTKADMAILSAISHYTAGNHLQADKIISYVHNLLK